MRKTRCAARDDEKVDLENMRGRLLRFVTRVVAMELRIDGPNVNSTSFDRGID
jgi:hypothetical protein